MTYQPGEQPYTQPQDPWSGTQGIASAPTDPLPQPVRGPGEFTPGVAAPGVWSQETVAHNDPYQPVRGGGRTGLYVLVVLLVIVLGGAGGFGAWWAITNYAGGILGPTPTTTTTTETTTESATPRPTEVKYAPQLVNVGDCLENRNPEGNPPDMWVVPCDRDNTYKVLKIEVGEHIPEDDRDEFTEQITARAMCDDVTWNSWFGWNSPSDSQDRFYCLWIDLTAS